MKGKIIYIVGDYGVGKTFLARLLEETYVRDGKACCVIEGSEFKDNIGKLIQRAAKSADFVIVTQMAGESAVLPLGWKVIHLTQPRKGEIPFTHSKS